MYDFDILRTRSVPLGPRSFSVSGPTLWISLPFSVEESASLNIGTFKKVLKTIFCLPELYALCDLMTSVCSRSVRAPL